MGTKAKFKLEIKSRTFDEVLFSYEGEKEISNKQMLEQAVRKSANLRGANLREANLREANLREADLREADLCGADLCGADLRWANLREANLREADLREADLVYTFISASKHIIIAHKHSMQIGCEIHEWGWWTEENINRLGRENKYNEDEISEYMKHIEYCKMFLGKIK